MNNLAMKQTRPDLFQEQAVVMAVNGNLFRVQSATGIYEAHRAVSCMIRPEVGDGVLTVVGGPEGAFILAILTRAETAAHDIDLQGDVHLRVRHGRLKITAQEGLDLATARDIRATSEALSVHAVKGDVHVHDGRYQGGTLGARIGSIQWLADSVEGMVERLTQRVKRLYRTVDEFEQVKAGRMDVLVRKLLSFRSQYTVLTSKEDVKVDAERIHIG